MCAQYAQGGSEERRVCVHLVWAGLRGNGRRRFSKTLRQFSYSRRSEKIPHHRRRVRRFMLTEPEHRLATLRLKQLTSFINDAHRLGASPAANVRMSLRQLQLKHLKQAATPVGSQLAPPRCTACSGSSPVLHQIWDLIEDFGSFVLFEWTKPRKPIEKKHANENFVQHFCFCIHLRRRHSFLTKHVQRGVSEEPRAATLTSFCGHNLQL